MVARLHQLLAEMVDIVREIDEVVEASQVKPQEQPDQIANGQALILLGRCRT
jgi:hypothetical protein